MGRRLCDVQRCVRTTDIDEVGDNRHLTIFEMVGNWSLGDYFKETAIPQSMGLLTGVYGIDPEKLYVTVFAGLSEIGMGLDTEAVALWEQCFADRGRRPHGPHQPAHRQLVVERPGRALRPRHRDVRLRRRRASARLRRHLGVRGDLEQRLHDLRARRRTAPSPS